MNPNYWTSGSNYRAIITDIGKVGNDHSFYLYANQPQVAEALHWKQPVEATAPFLH